LQHAPCSGEHAGHCAATHSHFPLWQTCPPLHANDEPHPPQLFLSVCSFTHEPLHAVKPPAQTAVHAPPTQMALALVTFVEHALPHFPQSAGSVWVSTHAPEQSVGAVGGHVETHVEFEHTLAPQLMPHMPQFWRSLVVSTHAPLQSV
jgi:hypothetical protein